MIREDIMLAALVILTKEDRLHPMANCPKSMMNKINPGGNTLLEENKL